jgi:3-oxoacyl-[acyl-carrier-protein] synthase II
MGMISPLGNDLVSSWDAIVNSRSGLGPITSFDASLFTTRIAGEIRNFDPTLYMSPKDVKKIDAFIH